MNPSSLHKLNNSHVHVAIIMDGSGRWAQARGLPRSAGHRAGVEAVRRVVNAAPCLDIGTLTLHAFSSDNWRRPKGEVGELLRIFRDYIEGETSPWVERGVRLSVIGRRDRLPLDLAAAIEATEAATRNGRALWLRLAIDYSGRAAILRAASRGNAASQEEFARLLAEVGQANGAEAAASDVDLLIRTGGEQRLSDFLLWEIAYAELVFTKRLWPDFKPPDLEAALADFQSRERRFGRLPATAAV
jgi:undecaprenyl diphosphate synthase